MKETPLSVRDGSATAISPMRRPFSISDRLSVIATKWQALHRPSSGTTKDASPAC
jgi:hypothetical protein